MPSFGGGGGSGGSGSPGTPGSVWRDGSGVPSNGLGINGDYYLNNDNGDVYLRTSGTYSVVANIEGPEGASGPQGPAGSGATSEEEIPSGSINGSNVTFTLSQAPASNSLFLILNGSVQYRDASGDYTLSGDTLTFSIAPPTGSRLLANYRV